MGKLEDKNWYKKIRIKTDPEYAEKIRRDNRKRIRRKRQDPEFRDRENARRRDLYAQRILDPEYRKRLRERQRDWERKNRSPRKRR